MSFEVISYVATVATATAVSTIIKTFSDYQNKKKKLSKSDEQEKVDRILATGDIKEIGDYIYEDLGSRSLRDLTLNPEIEHKFNTVINRIGDFFGEEVEVGDSPKIKDASIVAPLADSPKEYDIFLREFRKGEIWNALAKLRLFIEERLKNSADEHTVDIGNARSAGQILRAISTSMRLDPSISHHLGYAISVCNKVIHGQGVGDDVALEAIQSSIYAMEQMKQSGQQDAGHNAGKPAS